ncbi:MAG: RdgB/HAM1 family non-canonical purine NTP pyrophosphatase [Sphingobacteriales bacterium JAD_PAG50586_3]|nr:MAG: RdgB/HAM1 family non-canonical purine NTP pyrophosphatase [Sphingobacteriales bacterium JAD_PAG50586_3]
MQLIFATNNAHKLHEAKAALGDSIKLLSLADINFTGEPEETERTIEGNALLKARYLYEQTGKNCFADDTGLEVEVLNGEPGVDTAYYAGLPRDDKRNVALLLKNLEGQTNRNARFKTVIALIIDGKEMLFEGLVSGTIALTQTGENGFGYDPVFIPEGLPTSFAQMELAEKITTATGREH